MSSPYSRPPRDAPGQGRAALRSPRPAFRPGDLLDWRKRSLVRGTALVVISTIAAFRLSHFPHNYGTIWLAVPLLFAAMGTADTTRCMQQKWNWYHGGVVLCVYMDLMALCMILFFLVYPLWL